MPMHHQICNDFQKLCMNQKLSCVGFGCCTKTMTSVYGLYTALAPTFSAPQHFSLQYLGHMTKLQYLGHMTKLQYLGLM